MNTIIALAALGPWSYAGFLEQPGLRPTQEPTSASVRPSWVPEPDPIVPACPVAPPAVVVVAAEVQKAPAAPSQMPPPPPVIPPPAPTRYRLADASGQLWEHSDTDALRNFVEARNRSFVTVPSYSFTMPAGSSCAGGRCR